MPSKLSPRFLLSMIDLSRALKLAEISKSLAVTSKFGVNLVLAFLESVSTSWELNFESLGLDKVHLGYLSNFCDSLGLINSESFELSYLGKKVLSFRNNESRLAFLSLLTLNWEPMKVLLEYLDLVGEATSDDIVRDLGWAMKKRTEDLIRLGLITWQREAFRKPFNPHIVNAVIVPWGIQLGILYKDDKGRIRRVKRI